jgi:hypothetical protein
MTSPPAAAHSANRSALGLLGAVAGIALLLYGWHLGDSLLSDDFQYAQWVSEGLRTILRRTTVESNPQMIRPFPGLLWMLTRLPAGTVLLHAVSLALHVANAWLLGLLLRRMERPPAVALLLPILFVSFPLFGEAVIWLSSSFDLWACLFALLALLAVTAEASALLPALLFAAALLCKESVLPLPALLPLLMPWSKARRSTLATAAVAVLYLGGRFLLFRGPGGYLDAQGRSIALSFRPVDFARELGFEIPYRLLLPLQGAGRFALPIVLAMAALLLGLMLASGLHRRPAALARIAAVGLLAILPVAPVLNVAADLQGSRILYFPLAMILLALGVELRQPARPAVALAGLLAIVWMGLAWRNGGPWTAASDEARHTLAALAQNQAAWPAGAEVWVDAHDTRDGAYVFRNGLSHAAQLHGLRSDIVWRRGTFASGRAAADRYGRDLFEVSAGENGELIDWTACERALRDGRPLQALTGAKGAALRAKWPTQWQGRRLRVPRSPTGLAVRLSLGDCPGTVGLRGQLYWKNGDTPRFSTMDVRAFLLRGDGGALVRLPPETEPSRHLEVRVDFDAPPPAGCHPAAALVRLPDECGL